MFDFNNQEKKVIYEFIITLLVGLSIIAVGSLVLGSKKTECFNCKAVEDACHGK